MHTGIPASTVHKILVRRGLNRLAWIDRPTGRVIRRYERAHPGELIHLDVKKVGKIPPGGGWRVRGRGQTKQRRVGYTYLHCAVDDHSRVAYAEIHVTPVLWPDFRDIHFYQAILDYMGRDRRFGKVRSK